MVVNERSLLHESGECQLSLSMDSIWSRAEERTTTSSTQSIDAWIFGPTEPSRETHVLSRRNCLPRARPPDHPRGDPRTLPCRHRPGRPPSAIIAVRFPGPETVPETSGNPAFPGAQLNRRRKAPSPVGRRISAGQAQCMVSGLQVTGSGAVVAFLLWVQEVGSSNLLSPTNGAAISAATGPQGGAGAGPGR